MSWHLDLQRRRPDSATNETAHRENGSAGRATELTYSVLGVGNTQWKTYQEVPSSLKARCGNRRKTCSRARPWQRPISKSRRSGGVRLKSLARETHRRSRPRLKCISARTRRGARVLPESAYRIEVPATRAGRRRSRAVDFQQGAPALHAAHDDPATQGRNLSVRAVTWPSDRNGRRSLTA